MANGNANGKGADWGAITKWLVIGVVLIVFIFVLKEPLAGLVNRTEDVKISSKGVEIHTAKTAVGEVKYSTENIRSEDTAALAQGNVNTKVFVRANSYAMAWPKGIWKKDDQQLQLLKQAVNVSGLGLDMVCMRTKPSQRGFVPDVRVLLGDVAANTPVAQQVADYKNKQLAGAKIIMEKVDESTQGAVLVYTIADKAHPGAELYYIQRIMISNGKEYAVIAVTTANDDEETKKELLSILNSFKVIQG